LGEVLLEGDTIIIGGLTAASKVKPR